MANREKRSVPSGGDFYEAYRECRLLLSLLLEAEAAGNANAAAYMGEIRRIVRRRGCPAHRPRKQPDMKFLRHRHAGGSIASWLKGTGVKGREKIDVETPTWCKREETWRRAIWELWVAALCPTAEQMRQGHNKAKNLITLARQRGIGLELPGDAELVATAAQKISPYRLIAP